MSGSVGGAAEKPAPAFYRAGAPEFVDFTISRHYDAALGFAYFFDRVLPGLLAAFLAGACLRAFIDLGRA